MISPNRSACERQKGEAQLLRTSKYLKQEDNSKCFAEKLSFWFSPPDSSVIDQLNLDILESSGQEVTANDNNQFEANKLSFMQKRRDFNHCTLAKNSFLEFPSYNRCKVSTDKLNFGGGMSDQTEPNNCLGFVVAKAIVDNDLSISLDKELPSACFSHIRNEIRRSKRCSKSMQKVYLKKIQRQLKYDVGFRTEIRQYYDVIL